jgi:hypothetical protein
MRRVDKFCDKYGTFMFGYSTSFDGVDYIAIPHREDRCVTFTTEAEPVSNEEEETNVST